MITVLALLVVLVVILAGAALYTSLRTRAGVLRADSSIRSLYKHIAIAADASTRQTTIPLRYESIDSAHSPITGLTRNTWIGLAQGMLENVLQYTDSMQGPVRLPMSIAAAYPRLADDGRVYGRSEAHLETFARTLLLAAPLLHDRPELRLHGRAVADYYLEQLLRGTAPNDACAFPRAGGAAPRHEMVEAATVAICIMESPAPLWTPLSPAEQRRVLDWFSALRNKPVLPNNWRWFSVIINTFLKVHGARHEPGLIRTHLDAILDMHVDAGWYRDLNQFDYYSSWALQFYPIFWLRWDGDAHPDVRDRLNQHNDAFTQSFPHIYSRRGVMPLWGRSSCYRFAAASSLAAAYLRPTATALDPGFARMLCSGNLSQFTRHPEFLRDGIIPLGFHGEQPELIDDYSGVASPYWCAKTFMALLLSEDHPFWSATENDGFWADVPARYDIGRTGMWVQHDAASGHSRLFAPNNGPQGDARYNAPFFDTADAEPFRTSEPV